MTQQRFCCDQKCQQGRYCPLGGVEQPTDDNDQSQGLSTQQNIQFWGAIIFAFCLFGAIISCVALGGKP